MNLLALYSIICNELKDCFFETTKHQIASDTIARSNMEERAISFLLTQTTKPRECLQCKRPTQQSKFVSFPSLNQSLVMEWLVCVSPTCSNHVPRLKLTNTLWRPAMLTARMNQNLYSVECIYNNFIDTKWEQTVDNATNKKLLLELIHIICEYDPFHFTITNN